MTAAPPTPAPSITYTYREDTQLARLNHHLRVWWRHRHPQPLFLRTWGVQPVDPTRILLRRQTGAV